MNESKVKFYAHLADKSERDPFGPDGSGRAVVVNGRGFKAWRRFHAGEATEWVTNPQGQRYELTMNQFRVFCICRLNYSQPLTMRALAAQLKLSPSTISRAMVKLASFGLIAYLTGRGRSAVTIVIERVKSDGLDRFRQAAKAKVWSWRLTAERRLSRLQENVAHYVHERREVSDSLTEYLYQLPITKSATIRSWTPEELREVGII